MGRMNDEIPGLERQGLVRFGHGIFLQCVAPLYRLMVPVCIYPDPAQLTLSL
jgi:hypothetical protein